MFFVIFAKIDWFAWKATTKIIGFRIFFNRITKFICGMSLADRPMICKKLQILVTNIILSIWIQD